MISIIGAGRVGSALGFLIAATSLDDLVLVNRSKNKAIGEALDITNTVSQGALTFVTGTDDFESIKDSKVIVITASKGEIKADRTDLLAHNITLIKEISANLKQYADGAKIVIVTNPVDVVTYYALKETGFERESVIGMGSSLDSARFRYLLAKMIGENQSLVKGMVLGEHGASMVPIFSTAKFDDRPIRLDGRQIAEITTEVRNYWKYLREFKGASVFGAAKNTFDIIKAIINDEKLHVPASILLNGEYGLKDVCLGVPLIIGKSGVDKIEEIKLEKSELESINKSAKTITSNIINI
ncbi:MAG TPA: lactate dehydrogenase [Nitrosopumilaceae archaeon]|nr:lactate dehydrogenase [Nitrosopumilaceae archaeon]